MIQVKEKGEGEKGDERERGVGREKEEEGKKGRGKSDWQIKGRREGAGIRRRGGEKLDGE